MIRNCKNCAGRILYNVEAGKLKCDSCGSAFDVKEYGEEAGDKVYEPVEFEVYICNSCGAEVAINGTEASTSCIYCGNPTVVFSRVSQMNRPEIIVPFKISKKQAEDLVKKKFRKGFFVPREVKNFKTEYLRGIYIPYYVTHVEYDGSYVVSTIESRGKNNYEQYFHLRSMIASMPWVTTDASKKLSDSVSQRLEPYDIEAAVSFDEDYLLGFYSNMSDVPVENALTTAKGRVRDMARDIVMKSISGRKATLEKSRHIVEVYEKPVTAMLPAWFLTYEYKGKNYTMLVNGQTGKVVGGAPFNKGLFFGLTAVVSLLIIALLELPLVLLYASGLGPIIDSFSMYFLLGILAIIPPFIIDFRKTFKAVERTSKESLSSFVMKRQGDNK